MLFRLKLNAEKFFVIIYIYFASNRFETWIFRQQQINNKFLLIVEYTILFL